MQDVLCPFDGRPCEKTCPDRYCDTPDGGCIVTSVLELGGYVIPLNDDGDVAFVFAPDNKAGGGTL